VWACPRSPLGERILGWAVTHRKCRHIPDAPSKPSGQNQ
jgi:hypothetical protein